MASPTQEAEQSFTAVIHAISRSTVDEKSGGLEHRVFI